uniref:Uncharacterized protein n=1 Tax=Tanacetum cinerariifolium TaxID=118510 RepID=A0A6L2K3X8_TANCI|nr:hypothetical protein [Tanacetum cinerariifolium]
MVCQPLFGIRIPRGGLEMSQVKDIGNLVSSVALNQAQDKWRIPRGGMEMSQVEDIGNLVSSVALNQAQDKWQ